MIYFNVNNVNFNKLIWLIKNYVKYGSNIVNTEHSLSPPRREWISREKRCDNIIIKKKARWKEKEEKMENEIMLWF